MVIAADEYKSTIGLDKLFYALITADSSSAYTVGTPKSLAPAADASAEPNVSSSTEYADDQSYDTSVSKGETKITLSMTGIPLLTLAEITGCVYDAVNGLMYDDEGAPPDCALLFRSQKSNGNYKYYEYLKGKFDIPKDVLKTLGASVEFQTVQIVFTAIRTTHKFAIAVGKTKGLKRIVGDEDIADFDGAGWFTAVTVPPTTPGCALS